MKSICSHSEHHEEAYSVGIFRCPFCSIRQNVTFPQMSRDGMLQTYQQFANRWQNILYNSCSKCHRPMVLEKIIDNEKRTLIDVYQWINDEVYRFKHLAEVATAE